MAGRLGRLAVLGGTLRALGWRSVLRVAGYRALVRAGLHPAQRLPDVLPTGPFFRAPTEAPPAAAPSAWRGSVHAFGAHVWPLQGAAPVWRRNLFTGVESPTLPWWKLPDFSATAGDIKGVWELSRFDWVLALAQQWRAGDADAGAQLERWLADWCRENPAYRGPNWKCGQEASIRVMRLALAAAWLGQVDEASPALRALLRAHLRRIAPTIAYALGQDNNHGTSEAAALFIGGSWLAAQGDADGQRWSDVGRRWLEERARTLIQPDGTFSQYSVTYHRLMLETYTVVEWWRRLRALPPFSATCASRLVAATRWLAGLVDPQSGDVPNLGANDGAHLLPLTDAATRDFRPAVRAAALLFADADAHRDAPHTATHIAWLGLTPRERLLDVAAVDAAPDGGFVRLRRGDVLAVLRVPRFRFRPSHADPLHLDLWIAGENLLRDGGSFSYADAGRGRVYYPGIASHNTVQVDAREPMPRLGTFLWGRWLRAMDVVAPRSDAAATVTEATYRDAWGASHTRALRLEDGRLTVRDEVRGVRRGAVLRWRLQPGPWRLDGDVVTDGRRRLRVRVEGVERRRTLVEGWESRHYLQESTLPVLEVEVGGDAVFHTEIEWS